MSSTFSPTLRLELIGDGDQSGIWGQTTNQNLGALVEQAITGVVNIPMLDANYTMSSFNGVVDEARNAVLVVDGTLTQQRNLIAPLVEKTYTIKNITSGGFGVQIVGSSGTGVVIPNGQTIPVYCDGTNFYALVTGSAGNFNVPGNLAVTGTSTFTGIPSGPTAAFGTSTTQLATTAFVTAAIPAGVILLWSGSVASIPSGWLLCNGTSGTPDLRDRFVVGAGSTYAVGATGGATTVTLTTTNLPSHTHSVSASGTTSTVDISHTHSVSASGTTSTVDINHTHNGTTGTESANHVHSFSAQTGGQSNGHTHNLSTNPGSPGTMYVQGTSGYAPQAGFTGGTPAVQLSPTTSDVSADHTHSVSGNTGGISANHTHSFTSGAMNSNNTHNHTVTVTGTSGAMSANATHNHTVTVTGTSGATGSGSAFNILPPYYALAYIMKA